MENLGEIIKKGREKMTWDDDKKYSPLAKSLRDILENFGRNIKKVWGNKMTWCPG